jgi:hypothetical protein
LPKKQFPELPGYFLRIFRRQSGPGGIGYVKLKNFLGVEGKEEGGRRKEEGERRKEEKDKKKAIAKDWSLHILCIG